MKKNSWVSLTVLGVIVLGLHSSASASLTTNGTVLYDGAERRLIYDSDLNITWLDYSKAATTWADQVAWAESLSLTVNGGSYNNWRLPNVNPLHTTNGFAGTNASEWTHLFYTELLNTDHAGMPNKGDFINILSSSNSSYWLGTVYASHPSDAWSFFTDTGWLSHQAMGNWHSAMAVHPGEVSAVPVPAAIWLLGSGLAGLASSRLKRKKP